MRARSVSDGPVGSVAAKRVGRGGASTPPYRRTDRVGVAPCARQPHGSAHMAPRDLRQFCRVGEGGDALLRTAISRLGLSARAYHRVLKIARTIADLEGAPEIGTAHVSEAVQYRSLDRAAAHA